VIQQANLGEILKLTRPLVCVDVETHDKCPPERAHIIEMGMVVYYPDKPTRVWESLFRLPDGMKIHPAATEVHKITQEMVDERIVDAEHADSVGDGKRYRWPTFSQMAKNLAGGLKNCDYCGYNVPFDLRCIDAGMKRATITWTYEGALLLDPLRLWQKKCPRTNSDFVREFAGREPSDAHRALADIQDTIDGFRGFFDRHKLPETIKAIADICKDPDSIDPDRKFVWKAGVATCNFGKWNGTALTSAKTNPGFRGYLEWMMRGDFHPDTKRLVQAALRGEFPVLPAETGLSDS
jgi:DNA polymerase III epsilon subunit-like protein